MSDSPRAYAGPGWDAITDAMAAIHGEQEQRHWAAGSMLPGASGLYGVSAYDAGDHWHFVTFGLSELWTKESEDPGVSGFGYELTMRTSHRGEEASRLDRQAVPASRWAHLRRDGVPAGPHVGRGDADHV